MAIVVQFAHYPHEGASSRLTVVVVVGAGPVDHFCSEMDDLGWSCGWRNMQMIASHLLQRRQASVSQTHISMASYPYRGRKL